MPYPFNQGEELPAEDLNAAIAAALASPLPNWNAGTVTALGSGLTLNSGTLTATGSGGSVTSVASGAGLSGGPITSTGTLIANWQAGTTTAIGSGLTLAAGSLDISSTTATKAYADAAVSAAQVAARLTQIASFATTAALPAGAYNNGTAGVGATFTVTATGTLTIDGNVVALNDRILVKNQASTLQNGIYLVTTAGAVGVNAVLTRLSQYDTGAEITGAPAIAIAGGTANGFTSWIMNAGIITTVGTDPITYVLFTAAAGATTLWNAGTVSAIGNGIAVNSGTISADTQGTIAATATGTINPAGLQSCIVNMGTVDTTLSVSPGYQGQHLRLEIKQGATAHLVALDSTFAYGTDITSFTATAVANARDLLQLICVDGTHWAVAAVNHGFAI